MRDTMLVRRVYVTTLRICPQPPEPGASNRVLRQYRQESIQSDWAKGSATQCVVLRFLPEILPSLITSYETIMFFLMAWG